MKHIKLILFLLLCSLQLISAQTVNKSLVSGQRVAYALAKRLMGSNNTYKYYVSKTIVQKNGETRWLVFVDKMPRAGWEHPCSYVYAKPGDRSLENCIVVDSVCPPSDIQLTPVVKSNLLSDMQGYITASCFCLLRRCGEGLSGRRGRKKCNIVDRHDKEQSLFCQPY